MNKRKLIIIIVIIVLVILGIVTFFVLKNINKVFPDYEKYDIIQLEELYNSYNGVPDNYVTGNLNNYQGLNSHVYSCENVEEAIKYMREDFELGSNTKLLKCELKEETPYYYAIDHSYIDYRGTRDVTFNSTYIFMKNSVFDIKNSSINLNILDTKDKVREILNDYVYISNCQEKGTKIIASTIYEDSDSYTYVLYYFETVFGDYGNQDEISFDKLELTIDKNSGKINNYDNKELKSFKGKYNSYDY